MVSIRKIHVKGILRLIAFDIVLALDRKQDLKVFVEGLKKRLERLENKPYQKVVWENK